MSPQSESAQVLVQVAKYQRTLKARRNMKAILLESLALKMRETEAMRG